MLGTLFSPFSTPPSNHDEVALPQGTPRTANPAPSPGPPQLSPARLSLEAGPRVTVTHSPDASSALTSSGTLTKAPARLSLRLPAPRLCEGLVPAKPRPSGPGTTPPTPHLHGPCAHTRTHVNTAYTHTGAHTQVHSRTYTRMHTHTQASIHTYTHIHMYAHMCSRAHRHRRPCSCSHTRTPRRPECPGSLSPWACPGLAVKEQGHPLSTSGIPGPQALTPSTRPPGLSHTCSSPGPPAFLPRPRPYGSSSRSPPHVPLGSSGPSCPLTCSSRSSSTQQTPAGPPRCRGGPPSSRPDREPQREAPSGQGGVQGEARGVRTTVPSSRPSRRLCWLAAQPTARATGSPRLAAATTCFSDASFLPCVLLTNVSPGRGTPQSV